MGSSGWSSEVTFLNQGTHALAVHAWPDPTTPIKALVLMVHGLGEHMGRYAHVARALHQASASTVRPAYTCWPSVTRTRAVVGRNTSTREPNRIRPNRSPWRAASPMRL